ncbi:MAG: hypothetical protein ACK48C_12005 [Roseiflexaceae bacterium]|jgi:hypothetical protein|nr:hypothetical protein [Chloroflexaceae bacterium]
MTNEKSKPRMSKMAMEANGIFDESIMSIYEPQYDIFYNFRAHKNTDTTHITNTTDIDNVKEDSGYTQLTMCGFAKSKS